MKGRTKAVLGHILGWGIIVFFVVLLTLIFSFVGTIICAALAGMMMGSARLSRWHSLLASFIFPAVISAVLGVTGAALPSGQVLLVCLLCLGIFWATYVVMCALAPQPKAATQGAQPLGRPRNVELNSTRSVLTVASASSPLSRLPALADQSFAPEPGCLTLESLQGVWFAKARNHAAVHETRKLEICEDKVLLSVVDKGGRKCTRAKARLHLDRSVPNLDPPLDKTGATNSEFCI